MAAPVSRLADMAQWMAQNPASDAEIHSASFNAPSKPRRDPAANRAQFEAKKASMIQARLMAGIHWSPTPAFNAAGSTGSVVPFAKTGIAMGPQTDDKGVTWYPVAYDQSKLQPGDLEWLRAKIEAAAPAPAPSAEQPPAAPAAKE